jgi:hypothetical protein
MNTCRILLPCAAAALLFSGTAASACPNAGLNGTILSVNSEDLYTAQSYDAVAGGNVNNDLCEGNPARGYTTRQPDFTIRYDALRQRTLEFRTNSGCDSTLLVNLPDGGWRFDDDGNGNMDAKVRVARAPSGVYDVWVGRRDGPQSCAATLTMESF